jgi:hypothetical protein
MNKQTMHDEGDSSPAAITKPLLGKNMQETTATGKIVIPIISCLAAEMAGPFSLHLPDIVSELSQR